MSHETEIVKFEKLSNGQFSITIRCCGNASTDYTHAMDAGVLANPEKKQNSITDARLRVSMQHDKVQQAEQALIELAGETVKHE